MINQSWKRRWCGYCGEDIAGDMSDFQNHLNYCELRKVNQMKEERWKKREGGDESKANS